MMFEPRIKVSRELYDDLVKKAAELGYASVEEFITHVLEKAAGSSAGSASEEEVKKRLKGLGYLG